MLEIFTWFADWLIYDFLGFQTGTRLSGALHFFVEDTTKIFALLIVMIYLVALARASLNLERVRDYLAAKHRIQGYLMGSAFGAVTPFCSCSSIPLFLGFTSARIPVGITMAFLITSPLINEVAIIMLGSLLGWKFTLLYIATGMGVGIIGGMFLDFIHAENLLQPLAANALNRDLSASAKAQATRLSLPQRHQFAKQELAAIFKRVWRWVFIGVGLGAFLHGYIPSEWIETYLSSEQWWSVPAAVGVGIPLYSNATAVIPVMESLISKGLPVGTTLAFCMSTVAASFPEFILLKQVMQWRLLAILFLQLLLSFTVIGWIFNAVSP